MDKYLLLLLCQKGIDVETRIKCQEAIKLTIKEWQIYRTLREKEQEYQELTEHKLTKKGFWVLTTAIATASTQKIYLTGHNIVGIDSVNLKLGKDSEIAFTWTF